MNEINGIRPPKWMKRAQKQVFLAVIQQRFEAKEVPTATEVQRIEDFFAARGRIDALRELLVKEQCELDEGSQWAQTKNRVAALSRQLDAAEQQSHRLASDLGLL